jgi:hypothetical protein
MPKGGRFSSFLCLSMGCDCKKVKHFMDLKLGDNPTKAEKGLFSDLQLKKTEAVTKT